MKINKTLLESYARHLSVAVITAIVAIANVAHISPVNFTSGEWILVANTLWLSALPVIQRYFNKQDPAFGLVVDAVATQVATEVAKVAPTA
jgi:hypothetical protein